MFFREEVEENAGAQERENWLIIKVQIYYFQDNMLIVEKMYSSR